MGESSLLRGIKIVDALAEAGSALRYTDIREKVLNGLNPGSTSKILNELCEAGVLENGGNGYRLTRRVMLWSRGAVGGESIAEISRDRLEEISSDHGVTAILFVAAGNYMVCLERVSTPYAPTLIPAGESRPLNIIATGGVFLIAPEDLDNTDTLMKQLEDDISADPEREDIEGIIRNFRNEGIFDDEGNIYPGTWRLAVPVYINNELIAVLGAGAPKDSYAQNYREGLLNGLKKAASIISRDMSILNSK